jgi:hypothetical protein
MYERGLSCGRRDRCLKLWWHQSIQFGHQQHKLDPFSVDSLTSFPRKFSIVQTSDNTQRRLWREGKFRALSRRELSEVPRDAAARSWLRHVVALPRPSNVVALVAGALPSHRPGRGPRSDHMMA